MILNLDFTTGAYREILHAVTQHYQTSTVFDAFRMTDKSGVFIIRHDVDRLPEHALRIARIENELGIRATYYFRMIPKSFNPDIIRHIARLGHEIGLHYEELTSTKGDYPAAVQLFGENLEKLRSLVPVQTICMHGSPMSRWDNKDIWKKYHYHDFNILCEPYLDFDFSKMFYLTDTGMGWNKQRVSVRDKVDFAHGIAIKNNVDLIVKISKSELPATVLMNTHPERWTDNYLHLLAMNISQRVKNLIKYLWIRFQALKHAD